VFWLIVAAAIFLDVVSKRLVIARMGVGETVSVIPGILELHHVQNTGAAFSILQGKTVFLAIVTAVLVAMMCAYVVKTGPKLHMAEKTAIAMIVGGGMGNLIDRVMLGYVTDFLNIYIIPVFNVADCFVTCGCILLVIAIMIIEPAAKRRQAGRGDE